MDLIKNDDGSVDIYIGPDAPEGKEANWIPRVAGKAWFAYFRFYSPNRSLLRPIMGVAGHQESEGISDRISLDRSMSATGTNQTKVRLKRHVRFANSRHHCRYL